MSLPLLKQGSNVKDWERLIVWRKTLLLYLCALTKTLARILEKQSTHLFVVHSLHRLPFQWHLTFHTTRQLQKDTTDVWWHGGQQVQTNVLIWRKESFSHQQQLWNEGNCWKCFREYLSIKNQGQKYKQPLKKITAE